MNHSNSTSFHSMECQSSSLQSSANTTHAADGHDGLAAVGDDPERYASESKHKSESLRNQESDRFKHNLFANTTAMDAIRSTSSAPTPTPPSPEITRPRSAYSPIKVSSSPSTHPPDLHQDNDFVIGGSELREEQAHSTRLSYEKNAMDKQTSRSTFRRRPCRRIETKNSTLSAPNSPDMPPPDLVSEEEKYLLKVCRGLMMYGAPTHRLEEYMHMTAQVLEMPLQSFYMPGCMIVSFNDAIWRSTEVHIVRCTQALNLAKLDDVHAVYKDVIHGRLGVEEASARLDKIMSKSDKFNQWFRVAMYGLASAFIGPVSYSARPVDLPIIFLLGSLLGFFELIVAPKSELYAHIFEISSAITTSFLARAFGSILSGRVFCFSAIAQASLVLILPGFTITNSALELQSKNLVSGSVRMVYGIIFTLFLAFGVTIGTTIYGAIDSNASSATQCSNPWPFWWQVTFVAPFTLCYIIVNQAKWKKMPAMIVITMAGWIVNHFSSKRFAVNPQIPQALGALTAGILANLYSRLGLGLAVGILHPAIFIQVPGSFAATGSLISGVASADEINNRTNGTTGNGSATSSHPNTTVLNAGYSMIEIAIGITVGLSVSALLVYPFRKTKGKSGLFSF